MFSATDLFYGQTTSLCEECLALIPAKIIFENDAVYYLKYCPTHKEHKTLISTDIEYFKSCKSSAAPRQGIAYRKTIEKSCPYDCGLCSDHERHTAMGIIEVLDECNLHCPTCIAASHPGAGNIKSLETIERMMDALIEQEGRPDILMISGGEPTIHPHILQILDLAQSKPINLIMLISNGVRIANDKAFVSELKKYKNLEIYLQFDSLNSDVLNNIRGENLRDIRLNAINNLEEAQVHSTLVTVVKKGVNEKEMNDVITFALQFKYIRGVTFQPCKITGRGDFDKSLNYVTLSEVRQEIISTSPYFSKHDLLPHPLNPENISIGYLLKTETRISPVTYFLFRPETSRKLKIEFPHSTALKQKMYFTPDLDSDEVRYENLFRVAVVSFLDKFNFCTASVKNSCIHFVTPKGELIPLDTYYLFYQKNGNS